MHIVGRRFGALRGFEVRDGFGHLALIQQQFAQLVLRLRMLGMLGRKLLEQFCASSFRETCSSAYA